MALSALNMLTLVGILAVVSAAALSSAVNYETPLFKGISTRGDEEIGPIDNYTCTANGAFAHEDCEYFVTCWNGSAILHRCTEMMLFDLRYLGCNWPELVDCGDRHRPPTYPGTETPPTTSTTVDPSASTSPTTPLPNSTFECPGNGVFPHEKCEYYWNCYEGDALLLRCELDFLFDLTYNGCNFPDLTDCGDRERPPGSSTPTTQPSTVSTTGGTGTTEPGNNSTGTASPSTTTGNPGGFSCPSPTGYFPDPEDCGAFYSCLANQATHEFCPDGLHFNPVLELCDWPEAAGCESNN